MKNDFFNLYFEYDKINDDLNLDDDKSILLFNEKNKSIHEFFNNLVNQTDLQIRKEISRIETISFSLIEKNRIKIENLLINIENKFNESFFYSEYLEFISEEEFTTKICIDNDIIKILKLNKIEGTFIIEKDDKYNQNIQSIFQSSIFMIMDIDSDFQGNLFNFTSSFGANNLKIFLQNENFEYQISHDGDGNMIKLIILDKIFSIRDEILTFFRAKNSDKLKLNNDKEIRQNLNKVFYEITFSSEIKILNKRNDEFSVQLKYFCELNIYQLEDFNLDFENVDKINKNNLKSSNLVPIISKLVLLKDLNLSFKYEISKIFSENDGKETKKVIMKNFTGIINDCFYLNKETESILYENYKIKKEFINYNSKNFSEIEEMFKRILKREIIITKSNNHLSIVQYNNEIFNYRTQKEENECSNKVSKTKFKDSFLTNFIFTHNSDEKKIYFGEILKNKIFERRHFPIEKPLYNFGGSEKKSLNTYKFNMESNLSNILNKTKNISSNVHVADIKFDNFQKEFCKNGFGFEINDYSQESVKIKSDTNEIIASPRNKDCDFYLGYFKYNKFDRQGIFTNKNYLYFGEYTDSCKDGFGYLFFKLENDAYIGELKNNVLVGRGLYLYNENQTIKFYLGRFNENQPEGKGEILFKNNDYFNGFFKDNFKIQKGAYLNADKNCFYVKFQFDKKGNENTDLTSYLY